MAKKSAAEKPAKEIKSEAAQVAAPASLDEAIGQGLTPKEKVRVKSSSEADDYSNHPKFSKFKDIKLPEGLKK